MGSRLSLQTINVPPPKQGGFLSLRKH